MCWERVAFRLHTEDMRLSPLIWPLIWRIAVGMSPSIAKKLQGRMVLKMSGVVCGEYISRQRPKVRSEPCNLMRNAFVMS